MRLFKSLVMSVDELNEQLIICCVDDDVELEEVGATESIFLSLNRSFLGVDDDEEAAALLAL